MFFNYQSYAQTDSIRPYQEVKGEIRDVKKGQLSAAMLDEQPQFPGGIEGWTNHLVKNIKYPVQAIKRNKSGRVVLQFVVEKDGSLTDIEVVKRLGAGCDQEAVRVLKLSPPWKPGMRDGKPVRVQYTAPIVFAFE
jgi:periplasmic protein TonB